MISHMLCSNSIQRFMLKRSMPHLSEILDLPFGPISRRVSGGGVLILQDGMLVRRRKKSQIVMKKNNKEKAKNKKSAKKRAKILMMLSLTCSLAYSAKGSTMNQWRP
jgi:hypothetical protein